MTQNSQPSSIEPLRGKISHRWVMVISGMFVIFTACNINYSFGVFIKPLIDRFGWSRTSISLAVTIRSITSGITSPIAGHLSDRYGYKVFILIGIFIIGLGYLLLSRINNLWQLYLFLGVFGGISTATCLIPILNITSKWFGHKASLANGVILSGFSLGQMIIPPLATYLLLQYGWEVCLIVLGLIPLVLGTIAWRFIRTPQNFIHDQSTQLVKEATSESNETSPIEVDGYTLSAALHTPTLWFMFVILMTLATCYQMIVTHIVIAAIDIGTTPELAAIILTLMGLTNTLGRVLLGGLAAKIGNKIVLSICLAIQALAMLILTGAGNLNTIYIAVSLYGLAYGGTSPIMITLAADLFGTKSIGSILGSISTSYTIGGAIGPFLAGYVFDATHSYYAAFSSAAVVLAMVFLLSLLRKPPRRNAN